MLYLTLIGAVCAAIAPVGTLALSFGNKTHCRSCLGLRGNGNPSHGGLRAGLRLRGTNGNDVEDEGGVIPGMRFSPGRGQPFWEPGDVSPVGGGERGGSLRSSHPENGTRGTDDGSPGRKSVSGSSRWRWSSGGGGFGSPKRRRRWRSAGSSFNRPIPDRFPQELFRRNRYPNDPNPLMRSLFPNGPTLGDSLADGADVTAQPAERNSTTGKPATEASQKQSTQKCSSPSERECTHYVGVFERKMKEFRAQQRMKNGTQTMDGLAPWPSLEDGAANNATSKDGVEYKDNSSASTETTTANYEATSNSFLYSLPDGDDLSADRYLKIRHALRNYLVRTNVWSPQFRNIYWGRRKRCNKPNCPYHKAKKTPPAVCLPYIKKGQDNMLRFLISVMQNMMDRSCHSMKPYCLDKLKYKAVKIPQPQDQEYDFEDFQICRITTTPPPTACERPSQPTTPCQPSIALLPFPMPLPQPVPETPCPTSTCPPPPPPPTFPPQPVVTCPTFPTFPTCPTFPTFPTCPPYPTLPPTNPATCPPPLPIMQQTPPNPLSQFPTPEREPAKGTSPPPPPSQPPIPCLMPMKMDPVTCPPPKVDPVPCTQPVKTPPPPPPPTPPLCPVPPAPQTPPPCPPPTKLPPPPPPPPCPPEPGKRPHRIYFSFDPCRSSTSTAKPTRFPPWPTTKANAPCNTCPTTTTECPMDTLPPWPTTPQPRSQQSRPCINRNDKFCVRGPSSNFKKISGQAAGKDVDCSPTVYGSGSDPQLSASKNSNFNRIDIESVYDSSDQESVEEAQIDVHSQKLSDLPFLGRPVDGKHRIGSPASGASRVVQSVYDLPRRILPDETGIKRIQRKRIRVLPMRNYMTSEWKHHRDKLLPPRWKREKDDDSVTSSEASTSTASSGRSTSQPDSTEAATEISPANNKDESNHKSQWDTFVHDKNAENCQKATTLKSAAIVRGPKRLSNHPTAKVFAKVFPESFSDNSGESSTSKGNGDKTTSVSGNTNSSSMMHLQLLAVCEGYLEMVKLLKINNQTNTSDLDSELIRYCENEISKNFDTPQDSAKSKKSPTSTTEASSVRSSQLDNPLSKQNLRNKVVVDILGSPVYKEMRAHSLQKDAGKFTGRRSSGEWRRRRRRRRKRRKGSLRKGTRGDDVDSVRLLRKKKGALVSWLFGNKDQTGLSDPDPETEYLDDEEADDEDGRGDEAGRNARERSSPNSVRREDTPNGIPTETSAKTDAAYPVYASMYGYNSGGQLSEIEIVWRSGNDTRDVVKNVTVLAMLSDPMLSFDGAEEGLPVDGRAYQRVDIKSDEANKFGSGKGNETRGGQGRINETVAIAEAQPDSGDYEVNEMIAEDETTLAEVNSTEPSTILGHATTLTATVTTDNATVQKNHTGNGTYAHAVSTAKEMVKDYTIEFLNYAVYIIPIMFILLFLICCVCFILKIMTRNRKKKKKNKKTKGKEKVPLPASSETDTDTTESSVFDSKETADSDRKKTKSKKMEALKHRSKKLWAAIKSRKKDESDDEDETDEEKKRWREKKFLRFLRKQKRKKSAGPVDEFELEETEGGTLVPDKKKVTYKNYSNDTDEPSEEAGTPRRRDNTAKERQELIALLEELKNMESEEKKAPADSPRDKKEYKSVFVQYVTQEDERFGNRMEPPCRKHLTDESSLKSFGIFEDIPDDAADSELQVFASRDPLHRKCCCSRGTGTHADRKRFINIGVAEQIPTDEDVLDRFRRMSRDMSYELSTGTAEDISYKFELLTRMLDCLPNANLSPRKKSVLLEELDNFRRQLASRKYLQLKDDGVLCRL